MAKYTREQLVNLVENSARGCGVPPAVAVAQIARESANFQEDVVYGPYVAGAGERGMAQFIPDTWARFGSGPHTNAYDPDQAMAAWCRYMSLLLRLFGGDLEKALQGYNGGEGNVQRGTVSARARNYAREILAQAGAGSSAQTDPRDSESSLMPWLLIGGALVVAVVLMDD